MKEKLSPRQITVDFDGTISYHNYPYLGGDIPHAVRVLKRLTDAGHILILKTMRHGELMNDAKNWCLQKGIHFTYFNCNPMQETGSRKIYSHLDIDDHNLGIPLIHDIWEQRKPFVDWLAVEKILEEKGYL